MCLLIYKPAGFDVPRDHLVEGWASNPHGGGLVWLERTDAQREANEPGVLRQWRTLDNTAKFARMVRQAAAYPAIIHLRWATHGAQTIENVHPFLSAERSFAMGHNGILNIDSTHDVSDSRMFLLHVLEWLKPGWERNGVLLAQLQRLCGGSKVAVLWNTGRVVLLNEADGHWNAGVWYSNESYLPVSRYFLPANTGRGEVRLSGDYGKALLSAAQQLELVQNEEADAESPYASEDGEPPSIERTREERTTLLPRERRALARSEAGDTVAFWCEGGEHDTGLYCLDCALEFDDMRELINAIPFTLGKLRKHFNPQDAWCAGCGLDMLVTDLVDEMQSTRLDRAGHTQDD